MAPLTKHAKEAFKTLLNRYSEENYFYLARNYLGLIKTPFHKPELTTKLCNFFSQPEIEGKILSLIDEMDQIILSLVHIGGPLTGENIISLLEGKWSYGKLVRRVSNLQERMILLNDGGSLIFNPLFEERIRLLCSLKPLLGEGPDVLQNGAYCSTEFVRAYLNVLDREQRLAYKDEYSSLFPSYSPEQLKLLFSLLGETLGRQCVITAEKRVSVNFEKAQQLLALSDRQLLCLLIAEPYPLEKERMQALLFSNELMALLDKVGSCDTASLTLLLRLLSLKTGLTYDSSLLDTLSTLGVLSLNDLWHANHIEEDALRSTLVIDSDNTISYSGSCPGSDILYRFSELTVLDRQTSYQVTPQSFTRGLDSNLTWTVIHTYLENNSYPLMSASLLKMLAITYERYQQITIYDGIVLVTEDRVTRLLTQLESMQDHIVAIINENTFLMKRSTEMTWRNILVQSGVLVPAKRTGERLEVTAEADNPFFEKLVQVSKLPPVPIDIPCMLDREPAMLDQTLHLAIETMKLTKAERSDLEQRFKAKMILVEDQIVAQVVNGVIEAGGFDYQGKVGLCRNAVGKHNIALQLMLPEQELIVQALEVAYTAQKEALLKAAVMPDMEVKIIPVSKIFLVRQLRYHLV
ncbi:MAG TPA: hypothetical protein DCG32_05925 [Sphaerochaeta sp.]|jgi:hypothetical protein|nr:hypothetical protein [Sphaerochaeta sp.]